MTGLNNTEQNKEVINTLDENKLDKQDASKIEHAVNVITANPDMLQDFFKDNKNYQDFLQNILNSMNGYTSSEAQKSPTKLQEATSRLKAYDKSGPLTPEQRAQVTADAKVFIEELNKEVDKQFNSNPENRSKILTDGKAFFEKLTPQANVNVGVDPLAAENKGLENKEYDPNNPLRSMLNAINKALPEDKKIKQTAEQVRNNMKNGILRQITTYIDKNLKGNPKKELIGSFLKESFEYELTDNRINNLVIGGLYLTIEGLHKKIQAPDDVNKSNFNMVAVNILKDVKDINTLLGTNGNTMENLLKNSQDRIEEKIKSTFPKLQIAFQSRAELANDLENMSHYKDEKGQIKDHINIKSNPISRAFKEDITIDTPLQAINYMEKANNQPLSTAEQVGVDGADIQKKLTDKVKGILDQVPINEYEKEALKTELIQNKFGGWTKDILGAIYSLVKGTKFEGLFGKFNFFEKVLLSKERNYAQEGAKLYAATKSEVGAKTANFDIQDSGRKGSDIQKITNTIDTDKLTGTLNKCKKFMKPMEGNKEGFMTNNSYDPAKVEGQLQLYTTNLLKKWNEDIAIAKPGEKGQQTTYDTYKLGNIIRSDKDLVENFMQYVQTGEMPDGYKDKEMYASMKNIAANKENSTKDNTSNNTPPAATPETTNTTPTQQPDNTAATTTKTDNSTPDNKTTTTKSDTKNPQTTTSTQTSTTASSTTQTTSAATATTQQKK